jgi:hypothetical protein
LKLSCSVHFEMLARTPGIGHRPDLTNHPVFLRSEPKRDVTVAVGMAVTGHPPHRRVLAALPHTVLTLDAPLWAASKGRS